MLGRAPVGGRRIRPVDRPFAGQTSRGALRQSCWEVRLRHAGAADRVGFAGPLLASLPRLRIPVIIGALIAGLIVGKTGFGVADVANPTFQIFAIIGFAPVMFVGGATSRWA